jgi:hypothetical protein
MERESRTVHDGTRRGIEGQMEVGMLIWLILLKKNKGRNLLRLIVVLISVVLVTTHHGRLYVLVSIKLYKGLMLRVDDASKEVQGIEIGACRGIHRQSN